MSKTIEATIQSSVSYTVDTNKAVLTSCEFSSINSNTSIKINISGTFLNPSPASAAGLGEFSVVVFNQKYTDIVIESALPVATYRNYTPTNSSVQSNVTLTTNDNHTFDSGTYYVYAFHKTVPSSPSSPVTKTFSRDYVEFTIVNNIYNNIPVTNNKGLTTYTSDVADFFKTINDNDYTKNKYSDVTINTVIELLSLAVKTKDETNLENFTNYINGLQTGTGFLMAATLKYGLAALKLQITPETDANYSELKNAADTASDALAQNAIDAINFANAFFDDTYRKLQNDYSNYIPSRELTLELLSKNDDSIYAAAAYENNDVKTTLAMTNEVMGSINRASNILYNSNFLSFNLIAKSAGTSATTLKLALTFF